MTENGGGHRSDRRRRAAKPTAPELRCRARSSVRHVRGVSASEVACRRPPHLFSSYMADIFSKSKRSRVMAAIRSWGNRTTEERMRAALTRFRIKGWRRHSASLPGRPDFVFPREKVAVFVHGCFWHGCPRCARTSKTNQDFWREKVANNRQRDRRVTAKLRKLGYVVITIWECRLKTDAGTAAQIRRLSRAISVRLGAA